MLDAKSHSPLPWPEQFQEKREAVSVRNCVKNKELDRFTVFVNGEPV
jgi:hypothetical protein